jgi:hypothetical protein
MILRKTARIHHPYHGRLNTIYMSASLFWISHFSTTYHCTSWLRSSPLCIDRYEKQRSIPPSTRSLLTDGAAQQHIIIIIIIRAHELKSNIMEKSSAYSVDEVCTFLNAIGLGSKIGAFQENAIDGSMLVSLTERMILDCRVSKPNSSSKSWNLPTNWRKVVVVAVTPRRSV